MQQAEKEQNTYFISRELNILSLQSWKFGSYYTTIISQIVRGFCNTGNLDRLAPEKHC